MSTDRRKHIKLSHDFFDNKKIERLSPAAKCALLECWIECSKDLNDGIMPVRKFNRIVPNRKVREALLCPQSCTNLSATCPHLCTLSDDQSAVIFHDYLKHQTSRAHAEAISEKRSSAGRKGGRPKKQSGSEDENQIAKQRETKSEPRDRDRDRDREVGYGERVTHLPNDDPSLPPEPPDDDPYVPTEIGTAARPPKPSRPTPTEITFLRTHLGGPLPRDTETLLATIVRSHTRQGIPRPHIEAALREWATRDRAAPGLLPNLITDEIKRARAGPTTQAVSKADIWTGVANTLHNLEHHNPHPQKAIGQ